MTTCACRSGYGTQHPLRSRLRLAGRGPNNFSLLLPLAAVVVVAAPNHRLFRRHLYDIIKNNILQQRKHPLYRCFLFVYIGI